MVEQELLDQIAEFKEALQRKTEYIESDAESVEGDYSNRGNKLKRGSNHISKQELSTVYSNKPEIIEYNNRKRLVIKKRRKFNDTNYDNEDISSDDEFEDPYQDIKLDEILAPINHPSEIINHPAISKTYNSNIIRNLAEQTIEIIEKEQENVINFSKLLDIFLGDDPNFILPDSLGIPDYNHGLSMKKNIDEKSERKSSTESIDADNKRVTRKQSVQEMDPFFANPPYSVDVNFGVDAKSAEETRHLSQIALQRSQEFIRCLTKIRNGLIKTERYKDQIFKWSKEMAGDGEDDDEDEIDSNGQLAKSRK